VNRQSFIDGYFVVRVTLIMYVQFKAFDLGPVLAIFQVALCYFDHWWVPGAQVVNWMHALYGTSLWLAIPLLWLGRAASLGVARLIYEVVTHLVQVSLSITVLPFVRPWLVRLYFLNLIGMLLR